VVKIQKNILNDLIMVFSGCFRINIIRKSQSVYKRFYKLVMVILPKIISNLRYILRFSTKKEGFDILNPSSIKHKHVILNSRPYLFFEPGNVFPLSAPEQVFKDIVDSQHPPLAPALLNIFEYELRISRLVTIK